ncbi:ARM repeat-containing protein [Terfezia boudieri ATCC MYA-4762]|uniref:Nucleolar protein 9 n=1 Tax=Terfezia boudieri ATCC MYA-4762 TaxID=1051890 RepID=A0A3N4LBX0_9PEZI|nr:ARM repeat-containing protein [Terfezia boudieri ATCC MYA-4762]
MPKEKKKRGRRAEEARRKQEGEVKHADIDIPMEFYDAPGQGTGDIGYTQDAEVVDGPPFFGLLDEQEQECFRVQDELLKANAFETEDDRTAFVNNFFREADGKELKLANSQGCSRLLEKMMSLATPKQLKGLFQKCNGNFMHLVQHRFASHFCESLFLHSAGVVAQEEEDDGVLGMENAMDMDGNEIFASMESLFLYTLNELEPFLHALLTHPFASHTVRVLLLVLSGHGTNKTASTSLIQSRNKENKLETDKLAGERRVPDSFEEATGRILKTISEKIGVRELRILATHPVGSPTLQFLLQLELSSTEVTGRKSKKDQKDTLSKSTLLSKLLGGEESEGNTSASAFLQNLFYDSVGSHVLEAVIQFSDQTTFAVLYDKYFKDRLPSMSRNETASFVAVKVVDRLDEKQLEALIGGLVPLVPNLLERSLTNVLKATIDSSIKHDVDASKLVKAIADTFNTDGISTVIFKMLKISEKELQQASEDAIDNVTGAGSGSKGKKNPTQMHGSLLVQSILQLPGDCGSFANASLLAQTPDTVLHLATNPTASHVIQASLTSPHATVLHKRKLLNLLSGNFAQLAMSPSGSHLVDACWTVTQGMNNYRTGIAEELVRSEAVVRASLFGRIVWRNWAMDKYKTRRGDWLRLGKGDEDAVSEHQGSAGIVNTAGATNRSRGGSTKSAIQLARERRAEQRKKKEEFLARKTKREWRGEGTGANSEGVTANEKNSTGGSSAGQELRSKRRRDNDWVSRGFH